MLLPTLFVLPQLRLGWAIVHGDHSERLLAATALALQLVVLGPVGLALFNLAVLLCQTLLEALHHPPVAVPGRGWVEEQVCNARNTRCTALGRYVMGGHDLQIEHHLLPGMPRHKLRRAQPTVQAWCRRYGMPYREIVPLPALREYAVSWAEAHLHQTDAAQGGR